MTTVGSRVTLVAVVVRPSATCRSRSPSRPARGAIPFENADSVRTGWCYCSAAVIEHLTDADLLARLGAKLASGTLPRVIPTEVYGGPSAGRRCDGCDEVIAAAEAEIEVSSADFLQRFYHPRCFNLLTLLRIQSDH